MSSEESPTLTHPKANLIRSVLNAPGPLPWLSNNKSDPQSGPPSTLTAKEGPAPLAPVPAAKPRPSLDKVRVIREASAVLDTHKKSLVEKCLAPSLAKKPDPPNVKYLFNITFDAAGKIIARGVAEDRTTSRPEVLACIDESFAAIVVTPPGQTVLVDVPLELP